MLCLLLPACQNPETGTGGVANRPPLTDHQECLRRLSQQWNEPKPFGRFLGLVFIVAQKSCESDLVLTQPHGPIAILEESPVFRDPDSIGREQLIASGLTLTQAFSSRNTSANLRLLAAGDVARNLFRAVEVSQRVSFQNKQRLAQLDEQYRAGQITVAQYRAETETMRQDAELMRKTAGEAREARERLVASARELPQLNGAKALVDFSQRRLDTAATDLESALRRVPMA
jgi:hypothetical protein